jgi:hypothetical protein
MMKSQERGTQNEEQRPPDVICACEGRAREPMAPRRKEDGSGMTEMVAAGLPPEMPMKVGVGALSPLLTRSRLVPSRLSRNVWEAVLMAL